METLSIIYKTIQPLTRPRGRVDAPARARYVFHGVANDVVATVNWCLVNYIMANRAADWGHDGPCWAILGQFWALLDPSWAILGPYWGHLGPNWGHIGPTSAIMIHLGPSWGHLVAILGPSWGHLGAILGHLGVILGHLGAILGHFRVTKGEGRRSTERNSG